jgi:hypothetical protein
MASLGAICAPAALSSANDNTNGSNGSSDNTTAAPAIGTWRSFLLDASDPMYKLEPGDHIRYSCVVRAPCVIAVSVNNIAIAGPPLTLLIAAAPIDDAGQPTPPTLLHKVCTRPMLHLPISNSKIILSFCL